MRASARGAINTTGRHDLPVEINKVYYEQPAMMYKYFKRSKPLIPRPINSVRH